MERIILLAEGSIVKFEDIKLFLSDIDKKKKGVSIYEGSLNEIKKKVVMEILSQEKNNKSRASKRLEIDRGTLERIIS
ncbi:helix-turn-helix domain-containing protein [Cetobacterium sp.]|uniref:helix-turn-helix domain-containing protein n=1 Tax=Cetobacterium sp. TaxID=2071632 RepID=UPI003F4053A4